MFRDHARDRDHGGSHLPPPHSQHPGPGTLRHDAGKGSPDPDHQAPDGPRGGCRVIRDRVRGSVSGTLRDSQAGARSGPAARPATESGRPGCWSRLPLTASWPSLLLSATGFNSNAALPDVVPTATGRATLLSERAADSNREGHDAHPAPAAPGRGTAHLRPNPAPDSPTSRVTRQPPGQRRWPATMPATMITDMITTTITDINPGRPRRTSTPHAANPHHPPPPPHTHPAAGTPI